MEWSSTKKKIPTTAVSIVTILPLLFSTLMLVSVPIQPAEGRNLTSLKDINEDGRVDILISSGRVLLNVGENRFRSNEVVFTGSGYELKEYTFLNGTLGPFANLTSNLTPSPLRFVDIDGDGSYDRCIFTNYGDYSMILYRNDGEGTYLPAESVNVNADANTDYFAVVNTIELRKGYSSGPLSSSQ